MARDRSKIIEILKRMQECTIENGATPAEAARFAAKCAKWIEEYQISEAELAAETGQEREMEMVQNTIRTGKRVHNPGVVSLINGIAQGVCCRCVLLQEGKKGKEEAVIGVIGEELDANYVSIISMKLVPELSSRAHMEGIEHGHEKASLIRWKNQFLAAAGYTIQQRLELERKERSIDKAEERRNQLNSGTTCTALKLVTGLTLANEKRELVDRLFREAYPNTKTYQGGRRAKFELGAHEAGAKAGKEVGLHVGIEGKTLGLPE